MLLRTTSDNEIAGGASSTSANKVSEAELEARKEVPDPALNPTFGQLHLKQILSELRMISVRMDIPTTEREIAEIKVEYLTQVIEAQTKIVEAMEKEVAELSKVWNKRVLFYRTLQRLSDEVAIPMDVIDIDDAETKIEYSTQNWKRQFEKEEGRRRYLENSFARLKPDQNGKKSGEDDLCLICHSDMTNAEKMLVATCGVGYLIVVSDSLR